MWKSWITWDTAGPQCLRRVTEGGYFLPESKIAVMGGVKIERYLAAQIRRDLRQADMTNKPPPSRSEMKESSQPSGDHDEDELRERLAANELS